MATTTINPGDDIPVAPPAAPPSIENGFGYGESFFDSTPDVGNGFGLGDFFRPPAAEADYNKTGPLIDPDWARQNPEKANALLLDTQFNDFKERFLPLEHEALAKAQDFDFTEEARRSGQLVADQYDNNAGMVGRSMSRYGLRPSSRQLAVSEDARQRNRALGIVNAENTTRRQLYDRNITAIGDLASHGRGIASQSMQGMGKAAALDRQNKDANDALDRQHKAGVVGGVMSGAAMGAYYGSAVPGIGTAVGAVVGGVLGGALGSI